MLLLHGWGGSSRHWHWTMQGLADIRTIYAPDLPGYGDSPPLPGPTSAERLAECVIEFADKLHIEQFDVNGHSFGAAVAAYIAARYPERVRQVVISSFGMFSDMEQLVMNYIYLQTYLPLYFGHTWLGLWQPWMTAWQLAMLWAGSAPGVSWSIARPFFFQMPADLQLVREGYNEFMLMDPRTSLENTFSLGNPALRTALTQIQAPTLLVGGRQDMIVSPDHIANAARIIPNCHTAWVDDCGHVPMIEQPLAYQTVLHEFLTLPTQRTAGPLAA
jgi:pimeloyl-ACP methyl ester carboxylesterase